MAIGIDLGTTNSVVAAPVGGEIEVLGLGRGSPTVPSVVSFDDGAVYVGRAADDRSAKAPDQTVHSIKRQMGEDFTVSDGTGETYTPAEVSALILQKLTAEAERALDRSVSEAVITVPAYFDAVQRKATRQAGEIAGLDVLELLSEPVAAALAHGLTGDDSGTVFVYDLGGGTFDVSVLSVSDGMFEVEAIDGDAELGGDDWDGRIVNRLVTAVERDTGRDVEDDPIVMDRLWSAAQDAKYDLSNRSRTTVRVPYLLQDEGYSLEVTIDRSEFKHATEDLRERTVDIATDLLDRTGYEPRAVDHVLLVGGATRMPQIRAAVEDCFGQPPATGVEPDYAVAVGAAVRTQLLRRQVPVDGATPDATAPAAPATTDDDRTAKLPATLEDAVLIDVAPRTLGTTVVKNPEKARKVWNRNPEEEFVPVITRDTPLPTEDSTTVQTIHDDQTKVGVTVYQGESRDPDENEYLDKFVLEGLPPRPAGEVSVEVTFELDTDGVLDARAHNPDTDEREGITIESVFDMSPEELETKRSDLPALKNV